MGPLRRLSLAIILIGFSAACSSSSTARRAPSNFESQFSSIQLDWPVVKARFSRGYIPSQRNPHLGLDLAAPKGTPILAAHDGVVVYVGNGFSGFGNLVLIEGPGGWASLYAHLSKFHVRQGQRVRNGQVIGRMGATGRATGVHLHFELRKDRVPVDPLLYLPNGRSIAKSIARNQ